MHIGSYFSSFLLHGLLLAVVFFWPSSPPIPLDRPAMLISLTMGAPGGDKVLSPVLGPQGRPDPVRATTKPAPTPSAPEAAATLPAPTEAPKEAPKPEPRPEPKQEPKPEPKPADVPLVSDKKTEKPKPEPEPTPKETPKPKEPPKETPKEKPKEPSKEPAKPTDQKKPPSREDALKAALADAQKKTGSATGSRSPASSVTGALADLQKRANAQGAGGGGAGEGDGEGGGGLYDVYAGQVILAVRPNWSMPTYSRTPYIVQVRIRLDPQGNVLSATIERASGRPDFDASAVNAVIRTKVLPPPPSPEQRELLINFNSLEMSAR